MAASVNYQYPVPANVPSTTPPTQAVMATLSACVAQIIMADADASVVLTHNMQIVQSGLGSLAPLVIINPVAGTGPIIFTFTISTNTVTLNKATTAGNNGTFNVWVMRPNTLAG